MDNFPVEVLTTLILAVQGISVAWISRVAKKTEEIRGEVKNSHTANLREEQDDRHNEQMGAFAHINSQLSQINQRDIQKAEDIRRINTKLDTMEDTVGEHITWSARYVHELRDKETKLQLKLDSLGDTLNPNREEKNETVRCMVHN